MGLELIPFAFPGLPRVRCCFTTRRGGASQGPFASFNLSFDVGDEAEHVAANRRALADSLGISGLCELKQVHGDLLHFEPAPTPLNAPSTLDGDAQATSQRGLALCIKTADCQPVLVAHETGRFVAALHVGWRGNVLNLPGSAVERLCARYACRPDELFAVRGPSLGPERSQFLNFADEFGPAFAPFHNAGAHTVDLWALTRHQLSQAGLKAERIFGLDRCTLSEPEHFFSYRGARVTGRMMSLIWLT